MINIVSVGTFLPDRIVTDELKKASFKLSAELEKLNIQSICVAASEETVTSMGEKSTRIALSDAGINPEDIDQFVFISEGISDTLYMDTSKAIVKRLNKKADGPIHVNDYFKGSNGTLGLLELISNQVESNSDIKYSVVCSSIIWTHHSNNRILGNSILGDGSGTIVLSKSTNGYKNQVLSVSSIPLSKYNMLAGFKYGGTEHDITKAVIENGLFKIEILDEKQYMMFAKEVLEKCVDLIYNVLKKANLSIEDIDYIGISGTEMSKIRTLIDFFPQKIKVINSLSINGYLGSIGVIDVLNSFINNPNISNESKMLVVSFGIDPNIEAMIIKK